MALPRMGGTVVYEDSRDSGGMFDAQLVVEELPNGKFKAGVFDWHGGIGGPEKETKEDAISDLNRLFERKYGDE